MDKVTPAKHGNLVATIECGWGEGSKAQSLCAQAEYGGDKLALSGDLRNIVAWVHSRLDNTDGVLTMGGVTPRRIVVDLEAVIPMVGRDFGIEMGLIVDKLPKGIEYTEASGEVPICKGASKDLN